MQQIREINFFPAFYFKVYRILAVGAIFAKLSIKNKSKRLKNFFVGKFTGIKFFASKIQCQKFDVEENLWIVLRLNLAEES